MNIKLDFENVLFLDIETVPEIENFNNLTEEKQVLFEEKTKYQRKEDITAEEFYERAGIWAEFGKIICISVGYFVNFKNRQRSFRIKSFYGEEVQLLEDFKKDIEENPTIYTEWFKIIFKNYYSFINK